MPYSAALARRAFKALCLTALLWPLLPAALSPRTAWAQSEAPRDQEITLTVVILDVPFDGTRALAEEIAATMGERVTLYPQSWFEERIIEQGVDPAGLLSKREALSFVMQKSDVQLLLFTRYDEAQQRFLITFIPVDAEEANQEFEIEAEEALQSRDLQKIRRELEAYYRDYVRAQRAASEQQEPPAGGSSDPSSRSPGRGGDEALDLPPDGAASAGPKRAATISLGYRLIEPTFLFVTAASETVDSTAITLGASSGFALFAELFPMRLQGASSDPAAQFGVLINYSQVFSRLEGLTASENVPDPATIGQPLSPTSVSYYDAELGGFYDFARGASARTPKLRAKALLRLNGFALSDWPVELRSFRFFSLAIGADASIPLLDSGAELLASAEIAPFTSLNRLPQEAIGETRYSYTLSGALGLSYDFLPNLGASARYLYDVTRVTFNEAQIPGPDPTMTIARTPKAAFIAGGLFVGAHYIY